MLELRTFNQLRVHSRPVARSVTVARIILLRLPSLSACFCLLVDSLLRLELWLEPATTTVIFGIRSCHLDLTWERFILKC